MCIRDRFETEPVQNRMGFGGKRCGIGASWLDVYKRQTQAIPAAAGLCSWVAPSHKAAWTMGLSGVKLILKYFRPGLAARLASSRTMPVSYTHLDVYKRQARDSLFASSSWHNTPLIQTYELCLLCRWSSLNNLSLIHIFRLAGAESEGFKPKLVQNRTGLTAKWCRFGAGWPRDPTCPADRGRTCLLYTSRCV